MTEPIPRFDRIQALVLRSDGHSILKKLGNSTGGFPNLRVCYLEIEEFGGVKADPGKYHRREDVSRISKLEGLRGKSGVSGTYNAKANLRFPLI